MGRNKLPSHLKTVQLRINIPKFIITKLGGKEKAQKLWKEFIINNNVEEKK